MRYNCLIGMEAIQGQASTATAEQIAEPVYIENNLLRIFGVLFCHDPKRARHRSGTIAIKKGVKEKNIAVRLDPEYGQPGPFAHKVAMAIIRKQSLYGRPARKQVSFSRRELMRLAGRATWGGRHSDELALALKQIRYTHVLAHFKTDDRFVEHDFGIFSEVLLERRTSHRDPIVACTIVLADPIIQSLNNRHFTCLNYSVMQQLGTIGQALYMRLFFHFATQFDGRNRNRVAFKKRYDDIAAEWLGGVTVLQHKSKILKEQLGPHLDQLVRIGFLSSCEIAPAVGREGFVLTFRPGAAFFTDYHRFYNKRVQATVQVKFPDEHNAVGEPHQVAYLFIEKRTGQKRSQVAYVSSGDVANARELLAHIPMKQMPDFLDYALAEAAKTRFAPQTLGGVRQYLNAYLKASPRRVAAKAATAAKEAQEQENRALVAYNCFRREEAEKLFSTLPAEERTEIEALARTHSAPDGRHDGPLAQMLFMLRRAQITAQRHPDQVSSFDDWRSANPAAL